MSQIKACECIALDIYDNKRGKAERIETNGPLLIEKYEKKSKKAFLRILRNDDDTEMIISCKEVKKIFFFDKTKSASEQAPSYFMIVTTVNGKTTYGFWMDKVPLSLFSEFPPNDLTGGQQLQKLKKICEMGMDLELTTIRVTGLDALCNMFVTFIQQHPGLTPDGLKSLIKGKRGNKLFMEIIGFSTATFSEIVESEYRYSCQGVNCNKFATRKCSNCEIAYYCDSTCQSSVWPRHQKVCHTLKECHSRKVKFGDFIETLLEKKLKRKCLISFNQFDSRISKKIQQYKDDDSIATEEANSDKAFSYENEMD